MKKGRQDRIAETLTKLQLYNVLQILYLPPICHSICNGTTIYQSAYYMRLVAGGRCFYIFQLYRGGLRITK